MALHLSNLQELDWKQFPLCLGEEDTKRTLNALNGSPATVDNFITQVVARSIMAWAPKDSGQAQRIANCWRTAQGKAKQLQHLILVVALDIPAGCKTAQDVCDIWQHPLLGKKFHDVVSDIADTAPWGCRASDPNGPAKAQTRAPQGFEGKASDTMRKA